MKNIIVMCPTVEIATQKCKEFLNANNTYVCRFNKAQLLVGLVNGTNIYFKGETEGQRVLRGIHAKIVTIDEFPLKSIDNKGDGVMLTTKIPTLTDNTIRIIDKTSENKLLEELEALRIDVAVECQYQDQTGTLQDKYERANEMLDDCIDCVRKYFNKNTIH